VRLPPDHPDGIRQVQVGCGPEHIRHDWWNVDIRPFPGIDQAMDVTRPWPWKALLNYIYGEHFLEHLSLPGAVSFLTEGGNALREGGVLRLSTPSLEWVVSSHFDPLARDQGRQFENTLKINRAFHGWGHQFLYSSSFLEYLLRSMGFVRFRFCDYGQSSVPNLMGLERHRNHTPVGEFKSIHIIEVEKGKEPICIDKSLLEFLDAEYNRHVSSGH
jgi:predicted SAM-dependent methyltransferase